MYELSFQTPWHRPYRDGIHDSGGGGQGIFVDFVFHSPPPQFVLELWSAMADSLGVKVHQTTAYHPQTNGMCKQLHESLKAALWGSLTGLRCAVREDLWDSPAELVLGQPLRDPGEFMPASPPPSCFNTSMLSLRSTRDSFSIPGAPLPARPYCSVWRPVQGYSTRPKAFPFWTLEVGRRLFLLIDLSLHMSCMIKWCRPRPSSAAVRLPPGWQTLVFPVGVPPTRHSLSCLQLFLTTSASLVHRHP